MGIVQVKHPDLNCVGRGRKPASNGIWAPSAALCLLGIHCVPVNRCASGERQLAYPQFNYIVYYLQILWSSKMSASNDGSQGKKYFSGFRVLHCYMT